MKDNKLILRAWYLLYVTYGSIPIIAGFDKYFDYIADWHIYLNPLIPAYLQMSAATIFYIVGVIEIVAGLLVFIRPQIGGYIVAAWLVLISINLVTMGQHTHEGYAHAMTHYDVAIRDVAMAVGAYVLVLLSQVLNIRLGFKKR